MVPPSENDRPPEQEKTKTGGRLTVLNHEGETNALNRYLAAVDRHAAMASVSVDALKAAMPVKTVMGTLGKYEEDMIQLDITMAWGREYAAHEMLMDLLTDKVRERLPELIREIQQDAARALDHAADYIRALLRLEPLEGALTMNGRSLKDVTKAEPALTKPDEGAAGVERFNPAKDSPETAIQMARVIGVRDTPQPAG